MTQRSDETGVGTRAIRAATRPPRVDQVPASVPIYQTATFNADDTAELADILAFERPGYSYYTLSRGAPSTTRPSLRRSINLSRRARVDRDRPL